MLYLLDVDVKIFFSESLKLKFGCLNIHSIKAKSFIWGTKKRYVEHLLQKHQFEIFVVTETWLKDGEEGNVQIDGYRLLVANRKVLNEKRTAVKRGGGVAIYVMNYINIDIEQTKQHDLHTIGYEYLWIKLLAPVELGVLGTYIPPKSNKTMNQLFSEPFFKTKVASVTLGDFNVPANTEKQFIADIEGEFDLQQLITSVTYESSGNILDHIYISKTPKSFQVVDRGVIRVPETPSDHHGIYCILSFPPYKNSIWCSDALCWLPYKFGSELAKDHINSCEKCRLPIVARLRY